MRRPREGLDGSAVRGHCVDRSTGARLPHVCGVIVAARRELPVVGRPPQAAHLGPVKVPTRRDARVRLGIARIQPLLPARRADIAEQDGPVARPRCDEVRRPSGSSDTAHMAAHGAQKSVVARGRGPRAFRVPHGQISGRRADGKVPAPLGPRHARHRRPFGPGDGGQGGDVHQPRDGRRGRAPQISAEEGTRWGREVWGRRGGRGGGGRVKRCVVAWAGAGSEGACRRLRTTRGLARRSRDPPPRRFYPTSRPA